MKKKQQYSAEQLANDPSLRYCPLREAELVYSDDLGLARFIRYEQGGVVLALKDSIKVLPNVYPLLSIRRPSVMESFQGKE